MNEEPPRAPHVAAESPPPPAASAPFPSDTPPAGAPQPTSGRPPRRYVGIDYGRKRIGLALSDYRRQIASPAGTLDGSGAPATDARRLLDWASAQEADGFVVGLPLNMDGSDSDQTRTSRALAAALLAGGAARVELWDERLSSFRADELLRDLGRRGGKRDPLRDALAAQVILQSFLDSRSGE